MELLLRQSEVESFIRIKGDSHQMHLVQGSQCALSIHLFYTFLLDKVPPPFSFSLDTWRLQLPGQPVVDFSIPCV